MAAAGLFLAPAQRAAAQPPHACAFSTPWHVCVHGLGLGLGRAGNALVPSPEHDLAALLRISRTLLQRSAQDPFQTIVHELLTLLVRQHPQASANRRLDRLELIGELQHVTSRLQRIAECEPRASATALALQVFTQLEVGSAADGMVSAQVRSTLRDLLTCQVTGSRQHYHVLSATTQLLYAAQLKLASEPTLSMELQLTAHFNQTLGAIRRLDSAFYRRRLIALHLSTYVYGQWRDEQPAEWTCELQQLLEACVQLRGPLPPADEIHSECDFLLFPLSLALRAAASSIESARLAKRTGAVETAQYLLEQMSPTSRSSQFAFLADALLALEAVPAATLQERLFRITDEYLHNSSADDADAYLRCTYLIATASRLGCHELLPAAVHSRISAALKVRDRPASGYYSLPMVAAYALHAQTLVNGPQRITDEQELASLLERELPLSPLPASEARKLSYTLLNIVLSSQRRAADLHCDSRSPTFTAKAHHE